MGPNLTSYESISEFQNKLEQILISGFDKTGKIFKPNKAFISYSHKDDYFATEIYKFLSGAKVITFKDEFKIQGGAIISQTLQDAIASTGYFVLLLSENALSSDYVLQEISWALESAKHLKYGNFPFVIPVKVGEFDWTPEIEPLRDLKYIDLTTNLEVGLHQLHAAML